MSDPYRLAGEKEKLLPTSFWTDRNKERACVAGVVLTLFVLFGSWGFIYGKITKSELTPAK